MRRQGDCMGKPTFTDRYVTVPDGLRLHLRDYAGDRTRPPLLRLLNELNVPEAIFVGTSLGGLVTMAIAAMAPQRIAAAILNDVGPELSQDGLDRITGY